MVQDLALVHQHASRGGTASAAPLPGLEAVVLPGGGNGCARTAAPVPNGPPPVLVFWVSEGSQVADKACSMAFMIFTVVFCTHVHCITYATCADLATGFW